MVETHSWLFRYGQHAVRLRLPAGLSQVLQFLSLYFTPFFEIVEGDSVSRVEAEIVVAPCGPPEDAPDFRAGRQIVVDGSKGFLAMSGQSIRDSNGLWVTLMPSGAIVHVVAGTRTIHIFAPAGVNARLPILRVIEDVVLNAVQNAGFIVLHAAAVVADGTAVVAIGNKKAGKTSFLCESLETFATQKLANDNVCISFGSSGITVRGWPSFFKANVGTVIAHAALVDACPAGAVPLLDDDQAVWGIYEKVALYPAETARRFGSFISPCAPLGFMVLPQFLEKGPVGLTALSPRELRTELSACLQGIHNPNHPEWLGINPVDEKKVVEGLEQFIDALEKFQIPVARIQWAPSLRDLLRRLPPLRRADHLLHRAREARTSNQELMPSPEDCL